MPANTVEWTTLVTAAGTSYKSKRKREHILVRKKGPPDGRAFLRLTRPSEASLPVALQGWRHAAGDPVLLQLLLLPHERIGGRRFAAMVRAVSARLSASHCRRWAAVGAWAIVDTGGEQQGCEDDEVFHASTLMATASANVLPS